MKVSATDIDVQALARRAGASALEFLPLGEDSYAYSDGSLFVRLQPTSPVLEAAMRTVRQLPLDFVLKPVETFVFGRYLAAVFPFIRGRILGAAELQRAGRHLAQLHDMHVDGLPSAPLDNPFTAALERIAATGLVAEDHVRRLSEQLGEAGARLSTRDLVVTHGDPNTHNWLVEEGGRLWLCDWGDIAMGPRERDLFAFAEPHLHESYTGYGGEPDAIALEFYRVRWILQEIADYGSRLLDPKCPHEEAEHARSELAKYLG